MEKPVPLYKPEEVADLLKVSPETVRLWLKEGKLKGAKIGTTWRVKQEDIEAFLAAHTPKT
jgi:excisionase family DNA binding protein